ncbi:MAG TPA: alpha/beta hydrolase [Pirellulales bacterium]|jgi:pimeloyl-ACP methyl ester carboxylesterase|nr:alpha/beta hydrolase [Pirellulales bacterium]
MPYATLQMRLVAFSVGILIGVAVTAAEPKASEFATSDAVKHGTFTASDGVKIHYLEAGQGSPVVLIHGYTGTAQGNWFSNGVAEALAKNHRVVAIDCRGHGKSEKPRDPNKYGPQMAKDVLEMMDHLNITKAHVHGYSMGGFIVTQLLARAPDRFITASYGGSGVPETDPDQRAQVPKDEPGPDPQEAEASAKLGASPDRDAEALAAVRQYPWNPADRGKIDLKTIKIPVLAINGQFDGPNAKTHRMQRELANFKAVVLPGKSHLTAIMAGYIPQQYIDSLVAFINSNDKT